MSPRVDQSPVAIVGAGPVGLSLALGLARAGVRSTIIEKDEATSRYSKAPGIHIRTREVLRQWKVEAQFLEAGVLRQTLDLHSARSRTRFASADFTVLDAEATDPGLLILEQAETERILLQAVQKSGLCDVHFGSKVVGLAHRGEGGTLTVQGSTGERRLDASFIVGCDGVSSMVRKALGLPFDGFTYALQPILADVRIRDQRDDLPWPRMYNGRGGLTTGIRLKPGLWRIIAIERGASEKGDAVSPPELTDRVGEVLGKGPFETVWSSRFRIHLRSSPRFRIDRVLLAGDAAHVHSPAGGLGMNGGIQDAHNLAWKLAEALAGGDAEALMESYDVERRAVMVEGVSRHADFITRAFLQTPAPLRLAAFALLRVALSAPGLQRAALRRMSMIDLGYEASPLIDPNESAAGLRLPDPLLWRPDGSPVRLYDLLPYAPVLIEVAEKRSFGDDLPLEDVLRIGPGALFDPGGTLRGLLGGRDGWILVRPDAHIAWTMHEPAGMAEAVRKALGRANPTEAR